MESKQKKGEKEKTQVDRQTPAMQLKTELLALEVPV
jgi:hypothetical protein